MIFCPDRTIAAVKFFSCWFFVFYFVGVYFILLYVVWDDFVVAVDLVVNIVFVSWNLVVVEFIWSTFDLKLP